MLKIKTLKDQVFQFIFQHVFIVILSLRYPCPYIIFNTDAISKFLLFIRYQYKTIQTLQNRHLKIAKFGIALYSMNKFLLANDSLRSNIKHVEILHNIFISGISSTLAMWKFSSKTDHVLSCKKHPCSKSKLQSIRYLTNFGVGQIFCVNCTKHLIFIDKYS